MSKIVILLIIITLFSGCSKENKDLSVHIIDVGQGDSILIKTPLGKNILVDGGDEKSDNIVSNYLKKNKVKVIDILIATHFDSDHTGGLDNIIKDFPVKKVYAPNHTTNSNSFDNFINSLESKNIKLDSLSKNDTINLEKNININVLSPSFISENKNENSIVFSLDYINKSFLFTGDMEKSNEIEVINSYDLEEIDFLKVAHHGSYTSSTDEFIKEVSPDISVISCGYKNRYGHPHKSVLDTLKKYDSLIYRTDISGDLVFYSDGYTIYTKKNYKKQ